jgi:hypothetical protein
VEPVLKQLEKKPTHCCSSNCKISSNEPIPPHIPEIIKDIQEGEKPEGDFSAKAKIKCQKI